MRPFLSLVALLITFSVNLKAQNLIHVDVKPGYVLAQCASNATDSFGRLGLLLNQLNSTQTDETIHLTVNSSLLLCAIATDGTKKLSWKQVNPYKGFNLQYFDYKTKSILTRKVFIDPAKSINRMILSAFALAQNRNAHISEVTMEEAASDTFTGTISFNKFDLIEDEDMKNLNAGESVRKFVELYHYSNFTTYIGHEEFLTGDENRSGQNLILHFRKQGNKIVLTQISAK